MRTLSLLALALTFSLGCGLGDSAEPDAKIEKICANVTDSNWRTSFMVRTSHDQCVEVIETRINNGAKNPRPCIYGGYPMVCDDLQDGGIMLYKANFGTMGSMIPIEKDDAEKVRPNITYL